MTQRSDGTVDQEHFTRGFEQNDGGDFTLRSKDGVNFLIHSPVLRHASPVFDGLMSFGCGEPVVDLTEDARTISLMLQFVYFAEEYPAIGDYVSLEKAFDIASKYEMAAMTRSLQSLLWLESSKLCMRKNPIAAYELACVFGFEDIQKACYQYCITAMDLGNTRTVTEVIPACRHPRFILPLVARLARRRSVISELLHAIHQFPMNLMAAQWDTTHIIRETLASRLICTDCLVPYNDSSFGIASWQIYWANRACQVLQRRPLSECGHVFEVGFLCKPPDEEEDVDVFCDRCFTHIQLKNHRTWESWAQIVRETLESRLGDCA